ncbi:hypothetical protein [Streptomyces sp. NPDC003273]|uniref:hypothetical protein n=1 Tax=Streptomyces sp. NPDC003273 TaxID=3364678 RepID=UPI0036A6E7BC
MEAVHERHRRWSADGTWEMLLQRVQAEADEVDEIDYDISVNSTSVRAHHHAAGTQQVPPPAVKRGFVRAVKAARIRAELIDRLAEVARGVRRSAADKGYSNRRTSRYQRRRGIPYVIPEKADQAANRARRGSAGGRPPMPCVACPYRHATHLWSAFSSRPVR